jgi:hypothetical protein
MSDIKPVYRVNKETLYDSPPQENRENRENKNIDKSTANVFAELDEYFQFLQSNKWKKVKILLEKSNLKIHFDPVDFLTDISFACFCAENDKFIEDKLRQKYEKVVKNGDIDTQINALKMLQNFVKEVPEIGNKAFDYALRELEKKNITISIKNESGSYYLPQLFNQYCKELEYARTYLTTYKSLESGYRGYFGGLVFPSKQPHGLDKRTPQNVKKDSLLFHLVFICRHHTGGKDLPSGTGWHTMPKKLGKPCYPLVKEIADIILYDGQKHILNNESVTKCVQRLVELKAGFFEPPW